MSHNLHGFWDPKKAPPHTEFKGRRKKNRGKRQRKLPKFYRSDSWTSLRKQVFAIYGRVCVRCGRTKGIIEVDHIKPKSRYPHLAHSLDNLQPLCRPCNMLKSNYHCKDYRPELTEESAESACVVS